MEKRKQTLSSKEAAVYRAVLELFEEGADLGSLTVSEITGRAGIGKGTAYEYFSDKEEIIAKALFYNVQLFCGQIYEGLFVYNNVANLTHILGGLVGGGLGYVMHKNKMNRY